MDKEDLPGPEDILARQGVGERSVKPSNKRDNVTRRENLLMSNLAVAFSQPISTYFDLFGR
jgi:hypothetical protein